MRAHARARLDESRFGPALEFVTLLRSNVADGPIESPADVVASVKSEFERLAEAEMARAPAEDEEPLPLTVPALILYADSRWAELTDALLPDAPAEFREQLVATFEEAVRPAGGSGGALERYRGGADDARFGPMLPWVRQLRDNIEGGVRPRGIVLEVIAIARTYVGTETPVPALRLFADARWAELVDALLPRADVGYREEVVERFENELMTPAGAWKPEFHELRDAMYAAAGKIERAGGVQFQGMALPVMGAAYGATLMGERVHTLNAQSLSRMAVATMIEENRKARELGAGGALLQLTGVPPDQDPLRALANPALAAELMELATEHTPPRLLAALCLELEAWALDRKPGSERDLYVHVAREIRAALAAARAAGDVEDAEYE